MFQVPKSFLRFDTKKGLAENKKLKSLQTLERLDKQQTERTRERKLSKGPTAAAPEAGRPPLTGTGRAGLPRRGEATLYLLTLNPNIKTPESWSWFNVTDIN